MKKEQSKKVIYIVIILILCISVFSTIFALINSSNSKIISNVKISNVDISGKTQQEAEEKMQRIIDKIMIDQIVLKHGEYEKILTLKQMELEVNIEDKIYEACTIGRNKNIIANNYEILETMLFGKNIELELKFNNEIVQSIYNNLDEEWEDKFIENSYYIEDDKLIIVKGKQGVEIDDTALTENINKLILEKIEGKNINELEIPVITKTPEEIDLEKIKNEIYKEPRDASYDKETSTLVTHVNGVDFGITIDEAKEILKEEKQEYEIPLKITEPEITTNQLGEEAFPEKLASFSTRYDASNINRSTNIELASKAINGKVLMPQEKFSFNGTVGPRTKAKGYLMAGAYAAGELVETYGGGVCQVSSTLYNTVLYANLEIVERTNHSSVVSYVDAGRDATVSYGSKDFKFKNPRNYAIKLKAVAKNGILTIEVWGISEKDDVEIELTSEVTDVIIRNTKYVYDSNLAEGQEIIEAIGADRSKKYCIQNNKKEW